MRGLSLISDEEAGQSSWGDPAGCLENKSSASSRTTSHNHLA